jgi:hypothetical protein
MLNLFIKTLFVFCIATGVAQAAVSNQLESCTDEKEFKNLLKTKPNLLILFSKAGKSIFHIVKVRILSDSF